LSIQAKIVVREMIARRVYGARELMARIHQIAEIGRRGD
jgi:hypothetical protein